MISIKRHSPFRGPRKRKPFGFWGEYSEIIAALIAATHDSHVAPFAPTANKLINFLSSATWVADSPVDATFLTPPSQRGPSEKWCGQWTCCWNQDDNYRIISACETVNNIAIMFTVCRSNPSMHARKCAKWAERWMLQFAGLAVSQDRKRNVCRANICAHRRRRVRGACFE